MRQFVEEADLDFGRFHCCGDEDLYPLACPSCARIMVFCYECDTLYSDLHNLSEQHTEIDSDPRRPIFACPGCRHPFENLFVRDALYKVSRERWLAAGLGHLLSDVAGA